MSAMTFLGIIYLLFRLAVVLLKVLFFLLMIATPLAILFKRCDRGVALMCLAGGVVYFLLFLLMRCVTSWLDNAESKSVFLRKIKSSGGDLIDGWLGNLIIWIVILLPLVGIILGLVKRFS